MRPTILFTVQALAAFGLSPLAGCGNHSSGGSSPALGDDDASAGLSDGALGAISDGYASGRESAAPPGPQIPIVAAGNGDAPYQLGANMYGLAGSAFFAKAPFGSESVVLDKTQGDKICLQGTVEVVPTPPDGAHPPYSSYWGIDLGFDLNDVLPADAAADSGATAVKSPWPVPANVVGFWFTVEGSKIPPLRFKVTPTGKDPAAEQDSCALVSPTSGVPVSVLFTRMYVQCWDAPTGTAPNDVSKGLLDASLQVAADTSPPKPVDFCLTGFGVITQ
jgi:hypothetical protein